MSKETAPHPARWWKREDDGKLLCYLCPRYCRIGEGQTGFCYIRQNRADELVTAGYGRPTGFAVDPIEKKPLSHFLPGTGTLSFGTVGCNLGCKFCQNWDISKARSDERSSFFVSPERVVELAGSEGCPSISYTYNDPVIFGEYVVDISKIAREQGLKNVMVTAGYITEEVREEVFRFIDAANVDLKAFSEDFYYKLTLSHIEPVKETLKWLCKETDIWVEITTLLIPGLNDSDEEIRREVEWIMENLGDSVPVHFTAFHPDYRMIDRPATPPETLQRAREIAHEIGLKFVYVGNVHDAEGSTTYCPGCRKAVIERDWHSILAYRLQGDRCPDCGAGIPGRFEKVDHTGPRWRRMFFTR
jgi:pyruvate formate lyase activating enzyme